MVTTAVAAFVGCFSALLVLAELSAANKWVKYFAALVVGIIATILLGMLVQWVAHLFGHVAG